ncbi:helix-turn-helix transcriptional regulator [Paenibacillus sp. GCM10012303]|uniref:helix-turn-helix transcriptional regulator n=1 Tax=Paenibacillus sp. GCM10012303 TaxID=3317340 RepID=UPI00361236E2
MRLERLLAILMLIVNRKRISAAELAEKMEVSVRTIYRDIETLCQAGFPLVSYQGVTGGFEMMDGYRLDRTALTFDEISSVLSALKGMSRALDDTRYGTTIEKYTSLLGDTEKESVRFWQDRLVIDMNPWGSDGVMKHKVALIRESLQEDRTVKFGYSSVNGEPTTREVEPMTLLLKGASWYLYAYCPLRNDYRLFRLSRMSGLAVTGNRFERREHPPMEEADWGRMWEMNSKPVTLKLRFPPDMRARVEELFGVERLVTAPDGFLLVTQTYPEDEWIYGFLLSFGSKVEVLEPERVRLLIRDRAKEMVSLYSPYQKP